MCSKRKWLTVGPTSEVPYRCPSVNPDPAGVAVWPIALSLSSFLWEDRGVERELATSFEQRGAFPSFLGAQEEMWDKEKGLPLTFTLVFKSEQADLIFPLPKSVFIPLASCYHPCS